MKNEKVINRRLSFMRNTIWHGTAFVRQGLTSAFEAHFMNWETTKQRRKTYVYV